MWFLCPPFGFQEAFTLKRCLRPSQLLTNAPEPPSFRATSPDDPAHPPAEPPAYLGQDNLLQLLLREVPHVRLQVGQQHHPHVLLVHLEEPQQHRDHPRLE